jgi:hypothetical protein
MSRIEIESGSVAVSNTELIELLRQRANVTREPMTQQLLLASATSIESTILETRNVWVVFRTLDDMRRLNRIGFMVAISLWPTIAMFGSVTSEPGIAILTLLLVEAAVICALPWLGRVAYRTRKARHMLDFDKRTMPKPEPEVAKR